ncbi:UDP-N-acetylmuramoyl-L-alanyl-D-glutamate--2,6-diaminopimelate ligase [Candidatus Dojkabacteria bacterium]|nr:UDP-N-acetylmuramoyl-L-alanyl-D-glutamate--2,6-diaminopimelate ligase [Candidatus Dojkabacteria bacterium]
MEYSNKKKVFCVGMGGGGNFYIAKFFILLGAEVYGSDTQESDNVKQLVDLGVKFEKGNPQKPFDKDFDLWIYSEALPNEALSNLKDWNKDIPSVEVGEFFDELVDNYEKGVLTDSERDAFNKSDIAPLYKADFNRMKYIGVTGTDGKTTTCSMIYHILKSSGFKPAMITTVSAKIGDEEIDTGFHVTTPPAQDLYWFIKKIEEAGCTHVVIEATSHGLSMGRLAGAKFDVAVYTNITDEHLDYHKDWDGVFEAKSRLIRKHLKEKGVAVLNYDDERSYGKLNELARETLIYGWRNNPQSKDIDVAAANVSISGDAIKFDVADIAADKSYSAKLHLLGDYNISNALASIAAAKCVGVSIEDSVKALSTFEAVTGRMEVLQNDPFKVIVDFAHTPGGLENALRSVRDLPGKGRLIAVFGCAGKRDTYKRAKMGKIAAKYADITILTAEDPRFEKLSDINDEIEKGWKSAGKSITSGRELYRFDDDSANVKVRRDAMKKAVDIASPGDIVVVLGKSHEKSLCFGVTEYPWNDIEEMEKILGHEIQHN